MVVFVYKFGVILFMFGIFLIFGGKFWVRLVVLVDENYRLVFWFGIFVVLEFNIKLRGKWFVEVVFMIGLKLVFFWGWGSLLWLCW